MNSCTLGFHTWVYIREGKSRWCKKCEKKQEMSVEGKWVESRPATRAVDKTKYCECPSDYTIAIKLKTCPRCGLPRRPIPSKLR